MSLFKSDFQKASGVLDKAVRELERQRARALEIDEAIAEAELAFDDTQHRIVTLHVGEGAVRDMAATLDAAIADQDREARRINEYRRFRERQELNVSTAKLAVLEAEVAVRAAQRAHFEKARDAALEKAVNACRAPLRELLEAAGGAAYHACFSKGEREAALAWSDVCVFTLLESALGGARSPLFEGMDIDIVGKADVPVRAVRAAAIDDLERSRILELSRRGPLTPERLRVEARPLPLPIMADDRYQAGERKRYFAERVEYLERRLEQEKARRYPDFRDGRPIDAEAVRGRAVGKIEAYLREARSSLAGWSRRTDAASSDQAAA